MRDSSLTTCRRMSMVVVLAVMLDTRAGQETRSAHR